VAADELFGQGGTDSGSTELFSPERADLFGPDGTAEPFAPAVLGDSLSGLVTGPAFEPCDWTSDLPAVEADSVYATGNAPFPAAPDSERFRSALDKAMMTGPPTNPLRISATPVPIRRVRPGPTVTTSAPIAATPQLAAPLDASRRPPSTRLPTNRPAQPAAARAVRSNLAGRPSMRSRHPLVSGLLKLIVPIIFVLLVLLLHGLGGTLSGLFQ
jgi:hypothetical protein